MRIFGALLLIATAWVGSQPRAFAKDTPSQMSKSLCLRGKVISVKTISDSSGSRYSSNFLEIKLLLELVNTSPTPIIFLKREPRFVGAAVAKKPGDFAIGDLLVR